MEPEVKKSGKNAWIVLGVLTLLNVLNYMDRMVISVALEAIKNDMDLSDAQVGAMQSIFFLGVGLMILPAGILVDKWSRKKAVALMAAVWSIATAFTGLANNFLTVMISRLVCGAGEAGFQPGGTAWLSTVFDKKDRAKANGIFMMGSVIGVILGMALGGYLIMRTGSWRIPFLVFGIPGVLLGLIALCLKDTIKKAPETGAELLPKVSLYAEIASLFKVKSFVYISLSQGLYNAAGMTAQAWLVVLIIRAYGLNEAVAGGVMAVAVIPAILAPVLGGIIADKMQMRSAIGRPIFIMVCCLLGSLGLGAQYLTAGEIPLWAFGIVLAITGSFNSLHIATFQVVNMDVFPTAQRGKAAAMTGLITFLCFSWWGSVLVGWLSDVFGGGTDGLRYALLVTIPIGMLSVITTYMCSRHYVADSKKINDD